MIPPKQDPRWRALIGGTLNHKFKLVSAGMCVARNQRCYQQNPSQAIYEQGVEELHAFFTKYESLLTEDLSALFGK